MKDFELKIDTHIVIKKADVSKYLSEHDKERLGLILANIQMGRLLDDKPPLNEYYVVNINEPYSHEILTVIKYGEIAKLKETTNG